jgi:hypothetical protein
MSAGQPISVNVDDVMTPLPDPMDIVDPTELDQHVHFIHLFRSFLLWVRERRSVLSANRGSIFFSSFQARGYDFIREVTTTKHPDSYVRELAGKLQTDYTVLTDELPPSLASASPSSASTLRARLASLPRSTASVATFIQLVLGCHEIIIRRCLSGCGLDVQDNLQRRVRAAEHCSLAASALLQGHGRYSFGDSIRGYNLAIFCLCASATSLLDYLDELGSAVGAEDRVTKLTSLREVKCFSCSSSNASLSYFV